MKQVRLTIILTTLCLSALIVLCVLWEGWLAPLRPGGSWLTLKALPLMLAFKGVLSGKRYTYQWLSMLILVVYLTEGIVRFNDPGLAGVLAAIEIALSCAVFSLTLYYARMTAPSKSAPPSSQ